MTQATTDILLSDLLVDEAQPRLPRQRAMNALAAAGCRTALDVCRYRQEELAEMPGLGGKTVSDLRYALQDRGLVLRPPLRNAADPRHEIVLSDWKAGVPQKTTAAKLGVSIARIGPLRRVARRAARAERDLDEWQAAWEAQFTSPVSEAA